MGNSGGGTAGNDTKSISLIVLPRNDAPVGNSESFSVANDESLVVPVAGVLTNDFDVEGDSLVSSLISTPSGGSLSFGTDGSFVYVPDSDFVGTVSFQYAANDGLANSAPITVTINVIPSLTPPPAETPPPELPEDPQSTPDPEETEQPPVVVINAVDPPVSTPQITPISLITEPVPQPPTAEIVPQDLEPDWIPPEVDVDFQSLSNSSIRSASLIIPTLSIDSTLLDYEAFDASLWSELDQLGNFVDGTAEMPDFAIGGVAGLTTTLSVGYVVWLIRGGQLLVGLMAQLPAWQLIDPLPILAGLNDDDEEEELDDSLESIVEAGNARELPQQPPQDRMQTEKELG